MNNVNTANTQQSQITGYLIEKVNQPCALPISNPAVAAHYHLHHQHKQHPTDIENNSLSLYTNYYNKVKSIRSSNPAELITPAENENERSAPSTPMPQLSWANNHELWQTMLRKQLKYAHDPFYLKRHCNIEPQMRAILLDWLVEIAYAYRLHRETLHLAVEYMDRFLTCCKQQMRVDRLQLIGMTCLFLAAKVEEIYPPKLKELASHMESYSNNNEDAISQFELFILKTLNWQISPVTANTWLMTYLQIASINYYSMFTENRDPTHQPILNTQMVMPLNIYKNSNANKMNVTNTQQEFYLKNYMKSVALLDLCMFDMDSLKFSYSILAASAMYHMVANLNPGSSNPGGYATPFDRMGLNSFACNIVQMSTGYKIQELDVCIKWMSSYAEVCKDILTEEKMVTVKAFSSVDPEDSHNIQLYHQNLELLKEAQSRKTPCKFYSNSSMQVLLTPPDSHRKFSTSSSSSSSYYSSSNSMSMSSSCLSNATLNNTIINK